MTSPTKPTRDALINALPDDLYEALARVVSDTERKRIIETRTAELSSELDDRLVQQREAFRQKHAKRFADYDWKRALTGAPDVVYHYAVLSGLAFDIALPTAKTVRSVQRWVVSKEAEGLLPVAAHEQTALSWIVSATRDGQTAVMATALPDLAVRLAAFRSMSEDLLVRVAEECQLLQNWVNVTLELDAGKS